MQFPAWMGIAADRRLVYRRFGRGIIPRILWLADMTVTKTATIATYTGNNNDTRPTGAPIGSRIWLADTEHHEVWDGTNWRIEGGIQFADSHSIDALNRQRISNPQSIWTSEFQYNKHPLYFDEITANNGSVTHLPNESAVELAVSTDNGSRAVIQTFEYFRFQPMNSHCVLMDFVGSEAQLGTDIYIGYGDDSNGVFGKLHGTGVSWIRRSKTSGSVVDEEVIAGTSANLNNLVRITQLEQAIGRTLSQCLWVDMHWGTGRLRCGLVVDGRIVYSHEFLTANNLSVPSLTSANLPLRYEIINTQAVAATRTVKAIGMSMFAEGASNGVLGHTFALGNEATRRTGVGSTPIPICSIRPNLTLNSITNRTKVAFKSIQVHSDEDIFWKLVYKPDSITDASWATPVTHSSVQLDVAGTAISGGIVVDSGYVAAGGDEEIPGTEGREFLSKLPFTLDAAGTDQSRSISIVAQRISTTAAVAGMFNIVEDR